MPLRRLFLLLLSSLVLLGFAAISPAAALAAAKGTDHPLRGTSAGTLTASLVTGAATSSFTGHVCPLGAITGGDVVTFTVTGPTTFTYTGTDTLLAANGNEVFSTLTGSGRLPPPPPPRARRSTRSPAAPVATPTPAGHLPKRSAAWSSRSPRRARRPTTPPPSMDRSATRRSDTGCVISRRRAPADPVLIDTTSGGGPRQAVPGPRLIGNPLGDPDEHRHLPTGIRAEPRRTRSCGSGQTPPGVSRSSARYSASSLTTVERGITREDCPGCGIPGDCSRSPGRRRVRGR